MKKCSSTILFFLLFLSSTFSQADFYTKTYTPQQLQEDFQTYRDVLTALHPSLYWYTPKSELDSIWQNIATQIEQPLSKQAFYQLLASATAKINCGHTGNVANLGKSMDKNMPFLCRYTNGKLYLHKDFSTATEPMKVIRTINGHTTNDLLHQLASTQGTDGFIETPNPLVFNSPYRFSYRYHLRYDEDTYQITFEDGTSITRYPVSTDSLKQWYASPKRPPIRGDIDTKTKIATLTINTFDKSAFKREKLKFKKAIKTFFKAMQTEKADHLIIDLRNNGGGEDNYASFVYRYLTNTAFQYYKQMEAMPLPYPEAIADQVYLPLEVRNGLVRRFFIREKDGRYFVKVTPRTKGVGTQKAAKRAFLGQVYFLTSGDTYSAAAELTAFAKVQRPNTVFIGQETGGAMQGNTSAIFAYLTLKHSNISTYIPLVRYTMNIDGVMEGRGVIPDHIMSATAADILANKDVEMETALRLIEKGG